MIFLDKLGWPIETIRGRPVLNFLRRCIHTRRNACYVLGFMAGRKSRVQ